MKITVIGELCNDVFVYGDTKRLSPEAPVPVLNPKYTKSNNGMAGKNISESIIFANKMASIVVSKRGVTTP